MDENTTCEIHDITREGDVLIAFATVTINDDSRDVSYTFNSLPISEDGIVSALIAQFNAPEIAPETVLESPPTTIKSSKTTTAEKAVVMSEVPQLLQAKAELSVQDESRLNTLQQDFADLKGDAPSLIFEISGGASDVGSDN